jgi:hypothetical protein
MSRRLLIGLLTGVLMATLLPGVAVAKDKDDKSPCKYGGWAEVVREDQTAFADQSECVSYVAEGGTLAEPMSKTLFQMACEGLDGTHEAPYGVDYYGTGELLYFPQGCFWTDISEAGWEAAKFALQGTCEVGQGMGGAYPYYYCDFGDD